VQPARPHVAGVDRHERTRRRVHQIDIGQHPAVRMEQPRVLRLGVPVGVTCPDAVAGHLRVHRQRDAWLAVVHIPPTGDLAVEAQPAREPPACAERLVRTRRRLPAGRPLHHRREQVRVTHDIDGRHEPHRRFGSLQIAELFDLLLHVGPLAALVVEVVEPPVLVVASQQPRVHRVLAPARHRPVGAQPARMTHAGVHGQELARRRVGLAEPVLTPTRHQPLGTQAAHVVVPHTDRREHPTGIRHLVLAFQQLVTAARPAVAPALHPAVRAQTARTRHSHAHRGEHPLRRIVALTRLKAVVPTFQRAGQAQTTAVANNPDADGAERPLRAEFARARHRPVGMYTADIPPIGHRQQPCQPIRRRHSLRQPGGINRLVRCVSRNRRPTDRAALLLSRFIRTGRRRGGVARVARLTPRDLCRGRRRGGGVSAGGPDDHEQHDDADRAASAEPERCGGHVSHAAV